MVEFNKYEDMIESTIDLEQIKNHFYLIKSDFDPDLQEIKERLDKVEEEIQSFLQIVRHACRFLNIFH